MAKFYITTAIDYANSTPHLGTAYEKIGADVIARYRRLVGDEVYFVMGNDEHSQNVRKQAQAQNLDPKVYCDRMAKTFQATWKNLHISYDFFIRTSSKQHHDVVRDIAARIYKAKDPDGQPIIFKAPYEGHYCVSCEAFYQEKDLQGGLCPNHRAKPEWIREENYFFRLSAFTEPLKKLYKENPDFLRPVTRKNEILQVLEQGLEDISISRANKVWGVPLPFDENAVAYVWFDALINYVSAIGPIDGKAYKKFWPADLHVIGKDITRFHCLIWPAMLMAAKLPIPKSVWGHGFVAISGEKMSKSRGNIADPGELARVYGADTIRYHLMREVAWGKDGDFTEERLRARYNADLANDLGNLASRTLTMIRKYLGESLDQPEVRSLKKDLDQIEKVRKAYGVLMDQYAIDQALSEVWVLVTDSNVLIDRMQPWALAKDSANKGQLQELFYVLLERLRWTAVLLLPVLPERMGQLLQLLGINPGSKQLRIDSVEEPGQKMSYSVQKPSPLFPRLAE